MAGGAFEIRIADLDDPRLAALVEIHASTARAQTGRDSAHALDLEDLLFPDVSVWAAWREGSPVGVAALRRLSGSHGEIKSMHTAEAARRSGVGRTLLDHLIGVARREGLRRLSLETGAWTYFAPARALYASRGFVECGPFGAYVLDPNSVFMTLDLGQPAVDAPRPLQ